MRRTKKSKRKGRVNIASIDIREVLDDLSIGYTERGKNVSDGWIGVPCPFCGDQSNHLGINLNSKTVSCFKCGETGTVIKYLTSELGNFGKAINILGDAVPRELRSFESDQIINAVKVEIPKEAKSEITEYHKNFLINRGFDAKEVSEKYNMQFCTPFGKWANRIIIPVIRNYRLITFTSVDISDETHLRYKHESDEKSIISIKHHLFGIDDTNYHSVIVVEGLFDQLRFGDGSVATFGTNVTPEQKKLLSKFSEVKICFDGDKAGYEGADKLANELAPFTTVRVFDLPEGKDPDKLNKTEIEFIKNK